MTRGHAMITGCTSGLGLELAVQYLALGWAVTGIAKEGEWHRAPEGVRRLEYDALEDDLADLLDDAGLEPVDVLINNAGINAICPFTELTDGFIMDIFRVNTLWPVLLTQGLLLRRLLPTGSIVVNVISDAAWKPMRHSLAYNVSKAALRMATEQMARELTKPNGLTIFGVCPGKMSGTGMSTYIDNMVCQMRGWTREQAAAYAADNSISGMESDPRHIAESIVSLVTHAAANRCMSGAILPLTSNQ